ncbi:MAG: hypothetical protein KC657_07565 [Myxococcales bacterium]|nr:hypothetical protein [Myxococcales bacterium]
MKSRSELARVIVIVACLSAPAAAWAQQGPAEGAGAAEEEDPEVVALRERFRAGMDRYKAGAYAEAIVIWESVYRTIGREKGYRLTFNLARAYDAYGDSTRAAERYEAYVAEVARRRDRGDALEEAVVSQETDAKSRLAELAKTRGRLRVLAGDNPVEASVDGAEPRLAGFTAYVLPGRHVVTFGSGEAARRVDVEVEAGRVLDVSAPAAAPVREPEKPPPPPPPPPQRFETVRDRPFPAYVLWIGAGVTAASLVIPALTYSRALGVFDEHEASRDPDERARLANDYFSARSTAYATLAVPATLGAATLGLTAFYFFGGSDKLVPVGGAGPTGATVGVRGAF